MYQMNCKFVKYFKAGESPKWFYSGSELDDIPVDCADISANEKSYEPIPIYPSVAIPIASALMWAVVIPTSGVYERTRSFPSIKGK